MAIFFLINEIHLLWDSITVSLNSLYVTCYDLTLLASSSFSFLKLSMTTMDAQSTGSQELLLLLWLPGLATRWSSHRLCLKEQTLYLDLTFNPATKRAQTFLTLPCIGCSQKQSVFSLPPSPSWSVNAESSPYVAFFLLRPKTCTWVANVTVLLIWSDPKPSLTQRPLLCQYLFLYFLTLAALLVPSSPSPKLAAGQGRQYLSSQLFLRHLYRNAWAVALVSNLSASYCWSPFLISAADFCPDL